MMKDTCRLLNPKSYVLCRLHTIIDCDMVLVMDHGQAAEWGSPASLLDNPEGVFSSMVKDTGHAAEQFLRSVAYGSTDHKAERDQQAAAALQRAHTIPDWQADCRYGLDD